MTEVASVHDRPTATSNRWQSRPGAARSLRVLVVVVPVACAVALSLMAAEALPPPSGTAAVILWWTAILASSAAVMLAGEVLARRIMPLVALLRLSLLFPGPAPSRLAISRQSTRRDLAMLKAQVLEHGLGETAEVAAHTLVRLIGALDAHDRRTRGHSERVRALADLLAEQLHMNEHDRDRLRWAALLHDIGKLAVPVEVLRKPGRLTPQEWAMIHRHPAEGDRMLGGMREWLGPFAPVALEHHERWDGTGYPSGIAGEDICFGARVVAVADSYDVMTSVRSYQARPRSAEEALTEVVDCAGTQFDPVVARAMVNLSSRRLWKILGPLAWIAQIPLLGPAASAGVVSPVVAIGSGAAASVFLASGTQGGPRELSDANRPEPAAARPSPQRPPPTTGDAASASTAPGASPTSTTSGRVADDQPGPATSDLAQPCPAEPSAPPGTTTSTTAPRGSPHVTATTLAGPSQTGSPPSLGVDRARTDPEAAVDVDVLANDTDADGDLDPSSLRLALAPSTGTANVEAGQVRYRAGRARGLVRFEYAVEDQAGNCATGTVEITVA